MSAKQAARRGKRTAVGKPENANVTGITRDLRARLAVEPVAYSADGRSFSYEAPISADIEVGGWVTLQTPAGVRYLAQVTTEEIAIREGPRVNLELEKGERAAVTGGRVSQAEFRVRIRHTAGVGVILARETPEGLVAPATGDTFDDATIDPANGASVDRFLASMGGARARLPIGTVQRCADAPTAFLRADGFDRHTFLCGQSGSGKTYALGVVLEQLLLHSGLPLTVIDPNSDFVRLGEVRKDAPAAEARAYRASSRDVHVLRPADVARGSRNVLRAWFSDLAEAEQAATLRLDPLVDREEYGELSDIGASFGKRRYSLADVLERTRQSDRPAAQQLRLRIQNLRVTEWSVWAAGREGSSGDAVGEDPRAVVVDIGTLRSASEKAVVSAVVLGRLWRDRERRRPRLIVIDEAHNICPQEPANALQANATEYCINIAAEGRKFGLYLLLSTQRPQKVHRNVLSQCDNLMLMRMNSRADLAELSSSFSFVPPSLLDEAVRFRQGEALLAGRIVPSPMIAGMAGRLSEEGGADIPAAWADAQRTRTARKPAAKRR